MIRFHHNVLIAAASMTLVALTPAADARGPSDELKQAERLFREGRFDQAEKAYRQVLAGDESNAEAVLRVGELALMANRFEEAERFLSRAAAIDPNNERAASLLAEVYYRQDDFHKAAPLLAKAGRTVSAQKLESFKNETPNQVIGAKDVSHIPFLQTDPLPIIKANINGSHDVLLLIDTGGAELILDPEFADSIKAPRFGATTGTFAGGKTASVQHARIDSIRLGDFEIKHVPVGLLPTRRLPFAAGGGKIDGVLGTVLLYHFVSTLDYPNGRLTLQRKTRETLAALDRQAESGRTHVIPFWMARQHFILAWGTVNGKAECLMHVDTGMAGGGFGCQESVRQAAGIDLTGLPSFEGMGGGGPIRVTPYTVEQITLGDAKRHDVQALFGGMPPDAEYAMGFRVGGLVSHGFFRPFAVTFDFERMRLYLTEGA